MEISQFRTQISYCQRSNYITPLHLTAHIQYYLKIQHLIFLTSGGLCGEYASSATFAHRLSVNVAVSATKLHLAYRNVFNVTQARHSMYDAQTEETGRYQNWGSRDATRA